MSDIAEITLADACGRYAEAVLRYKTCILNAADPSDSDPEGARNRRDDRRKSVAYWLEQIKILIAQEGGVK